VLLVIDQLEELFTLASARERDAFLAALRALRAERRCAVVVTLRADFFGALMESYCVASSGRGAARTNAQWVNPDEQPRVISGKRRSCSRSSGSGRCAGAMSMVSLHGPSTASPTRPSKDTTASSGESASAVAATATRTTSCKCSIMRPGGNPTSHHPNARRATICIARRHLPVQRGIPP
jgi:hypothetical protein